VKISGSLISHHTTNHENIEKDQLPAVHADSLPQPTVSSRTRLPMTLLPDPSDEAYLKGLYKNSLEALVSEIIDLKSFLPISPSPVSYLRETQLTAYRRAEKLRSATENRILPRIDMYL
jgi:hypothetical protein